MQHGGFAALRPQQSHHAANPGTPCAAVPVGRRCFNRTVLLAEVVACSAAVGATRARTAKAAALAALLRAAAPDEIEPATAWLTGEPRQGRLGAGWRTLAGLDVPAAAVPSLEVTDVEARLDALAATSGAGSTARRSAQLDSLFGAATAEEQRFLQRLLTGELRQGALEGVMLEAVAVAARGPGGDGAPGVHALGPAAGHRRGRAHRRRGGAGGGGRWRSAARSGRCSPAPAESLGAALAELGPDVRSSTSSTAPASRSTATATRSGCGPARCARSPTRVPELVELVRALPCADRGARRRDSRPDRRRPPAPVPGDDEPVRRQLTHELLLRPFFFDCLHLDGVDLLDEPLSRPARGAASASPVPHRMPGGAATVGRRGRRRCWTRRWPPGTRASWSRRSTRRTRRAGAGGPGRR